MSKNKNSELRQVSKSCTRGMRVQSIRCDKIGKVTDLAVTQKADIERKNGKLRVTLNMVVHGRMACGR